MDEADKTLHRIAGLLSECNDLIQKMTNDAAGIKDQIKEINWDVDLPNPSRRGRKVLGDNKQPKGKRATT